MSIVLPNPTRIASGAKDEAGNMIDLSTARTDEEWAEAFVWWITGGPVDRADAIALLQERLRKAREETK